MDHNWIFGNKNYQWNIRLKKESHFRDFFYLKKV